MKSPYIASAVYDWVFFIAAPLIALAIAALVFFRFIPDSSVSLGHYHGAFWHLVVMLLMTQSHLFIVIVRAYLNKGIFQRFKRRLIYFPLLLFLGCFISQWFLVALIVVNVWWDAYHSSLQTFGFARLYDSRAGQDLIRGRAWDWGLAVVIYLGPLLSGALFLDHVSKFSLFRSVGDLFFMGVPDMAAEWQGQIRYWVILGSILYLSIYILRAFWRWHNGATLVWPKIYLLLFTALVSVFAWGFNSFGMAYIIVNFFHAWQYYGLVYWSEKDNLASLFGVAGKAWAGLMALVFILVLGLGFGFWMLYWVSPVDPGRIAVSVIAIVGAMHFYYDSFIWSVRSGDI